jgi:hypothetical protein
MTTARRALTVLGWLLALGPGGARAQEPAPVVAATTPAAPPSAADERAIAEEILRAQAAESTEERQRLQFYGFADMSYYQALTESSPWFQYLPRYPSFVMGSFNLYADANIAPRWRALAEVRLLYSPLGSRSGPDAAGVEHVVDTTIDDPAEPGRMMQWGGVSLVRAWLEYEAHPLLTIRVGHFLSPFGIWNVDHSSVVVIGVRQPFSVRSSWFPESQTGVEVYGATDRAAFRIGYHLTLSNGNGLAEALRDYDHRKAVGGRLYVSHPGALEATLGASGYRGGGTSLHYQYSLGPDGRPVRNEVIDVATDDLALAADLRVGYRGFLFQSEWIERQQRYREDGRQIVEGMAGKFYPDHVSWGVYGLVGYRIARLRLMPYFTVEYINENFLGQVAQIGGNFGHPLVLYGGLNFRPLPNVVFKLEIESGNFVHAAPGSWGEHPFNALQAQAAWAF